jgi:hypothetical protein
MPCVVGTIAVDRQIRDKNVVDCFKSRPDDTVDALIKTIHQPERRFTLALSDKRDAAE